MATNPPNNLQNVNIQLAVNMEETMNKIMSRIPYVLDEQIHRMSQIGEALSGALLSAASLFESTTYNTLITATDTLLERVQQSLERICSLDIYAEIIAQRLIDYDNTIQNLYKRFENFELVSQRAYDAIARFNQRSVDIESLVNAWQINLLELLNKVTIEECECNELETEEGFSCNEEIYEALEEQVNNPIGFQERFANWTEKKIKQFFLVWMILSFVWENFMQPYFQENIGKPVMARTVAHIKEIPEVAGNFIADLKENIEAIITENCPYYYKVVFVDENGETKEGYVSKRSVRVIETPEESEENMSE